jgi:hypothetical protein
MTSHALRCPATCLIVWALAAVSLAPAAEKEDVTVAAPTAAEINQLRQMILEQQRQIDDLRRAMAELKRTPDERPSYKKLGEVTSTTPMLPAPPPALPAPQQSTAEETSSPLALRIGNTYITPIGFLDMTAVFRDTDAGSNVGTSFGSIPYRNAANVPGNLSEFRLSPQNSRIGFRFDSIFKRTKVLAYWESDFLGGVGNPPTGNLSVSTNSYAPRLRLFWVDLKKDKWEVLAGQTWGLMTPNRKGISPLPGDVFYSQTVDVNYTLGIPWARIPEYRFVYHPSEKVAFGIALSNAEQYIGGSSGGGPVTLPSGLATAYAAQLNNGGTTLSVPNLHPDIVAKLAFDPTPKFHIEAGGLERTFKVYNPANLNKYTTVGGAGFLNLNGEVAKGLRLFVNTYYSDGGGRYIFGQAPDMVVRGDGSLSAIHSASTTDGFEFTRGNTMFYAYYGGVFIGRNSVIDPASGKPVGYGFAGSANSNNRTIQEGTLGFNQTIWKDAKYGALNLMGQYAYFTRNPWFVVSGTPKDTHMNEVWFNVRYTLPGSAPSLK